jgi:diguanylate cyclase (GGDEF)-like protein
MKKPFSINQVALAALVVAVVSIAAVSAISVIALHNLIDANARVMRLQRIISSLESIRFQALAVDNSEQTYVITGDKSDLSDFLSGGIEMREEAAYLIKLRNEFPKLNLLADTLQNAINQLIIAEKKTVDTRRAAGFAAAQTIIRSDKDDAAQRLVIATTYQILLDARRLLRELEVTQVEFADRVERWIIALISSAALVLIFFHGVVRKLSLEQLAARDKIAHQAMHDSLTGLANRPAVIEHLDNRLTDAETERALGGFAVMLLDLDGFKAVNDQMGHDAGDALLIIVAERLNTTLRDSDFIARLGGDEFLVVLPQISDRETATLVANKLVNAIAKPYPIKANTANVSASIGVSLFPQDGGDRETLMKCADIAMYEAKRAGRNQARFFEAGLRVA